MKYISLICTISIVFSAAMDPIQRLSADLDLIVPGGSDWFVKWGIEETLLDTVEAAMTGKPIPHDAPKDMLNFATIGYYVLYKNPGITMTGFISSCSNIARNLNIPSSQTKWARFYTQQHSFTTCPQWLHNMLISLHRRRLGLGDTINHVMKFIQENPGLRNSLNFPPSTEERHFHVQIATLVTLWLDFCVDGPAGACVLNMSTERWEPILETRERMNRFMLLRILKK